MSLKSSHPACVNTFTHLVNHRVKWPWLIVELLVSESHKKSSDMTTPVLTSKWCFRPCEMIQQVLCLTHSRGPDSNPNASVEVTVWWNHQNHIIGKKHRFNPEATILDTLHPEAAPRDSVKKITNKSNDKAGVLIQIQSCLGAWKTDSGFSFSTRADQAGKREEEQAEQNASNCQSFEQFQLKAGQAGGLCLSMTSPASWAATYPKWQTPLVDLKWCHMPLKQH